MEFKLKPWVSNDFVSYDTFDNINENDKIIIVKTDKISYVKSVKWYEETKNS